jgi:hypothetical protein
MARVGKNTAFLPQPAAFLDGEPRAMAGLCAGAQQP